MISRVLLLALAAVALAGFSLFGRDEVGEPAAPGLETGMCRGMGN